MENKSHVNQVAAFEKLVGFCNAQGAMFNPSKDSINSAALNALLASARQSLDLVKAVSTAYAMLLTSGRRLSEEFQNSSQG